MLNKKYDVYFFSWFLGSTIICTILNLVMGSLFVDPDYGKIIGIDLVIVNEISYFTIWVNVATAIWAAVNLVYLKNPVVKSCSKQAFTLITTLNIVLIVVFVGSFILQRSIIVAFTTWWQILKSVIEHIISPVLILLFYFLSKTEKIQTKKYFLKHSWWTMLLPAIYLTFIISRSFFLHSLGDENVSAIGFFPYAQLDPYVNDVYISVLLVLAVLIAPIVVSTLINYCSNLVLDQLAIKKTKTMSETLIVKNQHK